MLYCPINFVPNVTLVITIVVPSSCQVLTNFLFGSNKFSQIIVKAVNPCRLGEIALRNFVVERLRQKYCLSEASLFLSSEDDKILADLSAAASFFCFSFLREKRERKFLCRTYGTLILLWACLQAFRATLSIPAYNLSSLTGLLLR